MTRITSASSDAPSPWRTPLRAFARLTALLGAASLAGCISVGGGGVATSPSAIVGELPAPTDAKVIGDGATTVSLLVPVTAGGSASGLAQSFVNAAELAMNEVGEDNIRIVVRDTGGETEKARMSADQALGEGTQIVLGPVFSPAVSGAADAARAANIPVVAFSTDASVAGRGVYLLSFLPRQDATRVVRYAASRGLGAFAALVPENGYGIVSEAAFREAVANAGGRVVTVVRYQPGEIAQAAQGLTAAGAFDALFVPGGGDDPAAAAKAIRALGLSPRLLGSGQWDTSAVISDPVLAGAWYPGPTPGGFDNFSQRYRAAYGAPPPRTASLVYDATLLANGLVGARGAGAFQPGSLEAQEGFVGVDGVFRLTRNGLSERGLAVFEVKPGGQAVIVDAAPTNFR